MTKQNNVSPIMGKPKIDKTGFINAGLLEPKPSDPVATGKPVKAKKAVTPGEDMELLGTRLPKKLKARFLAKTKLEGVSATTLINGWVKDYLGS